MYRIGVNRRRVNNMKRRLSILVVLLCSVAYDSHAQTTAVSNGSSPGSASKQRPPSGIFDPLGLISPSEQGQLTTLGTGFSFTAGPAVDRHGNVFFTDQPNDRIYRWEAAPGDITLFLPGTGRAQGMANDSDGNLSTCSDLCGGLGEVDHA